MWPLRTKVTAAKLAVKYSTLFMGMGATRWLNRSYLLLAQEGFENNPVVYSCVTKLARAASSVDLQLYAKTKAGKIKKIDRHEILDLIDRPNPMWTGRKFVEKMATQYLIGGNAYVWGNGADIKRANPKPPTELWLLPPPLMHVEGTRRSFLPDYYEFRPGTESPVRYPIDKVTGQSVVCHLRTVNPLNEWLGLPPLAAAAYGVDIFNSGQAWNKALLQNEGRPSGALQMRQGKDGFAPTLTDDQFKRLREEVDNQYSGPTNAGRPLLLDSALEWVQMSLSSKDMDHRETMLTNARFIAACFGTPPQLVNIPGESTYSNYEQATMAYWADTVLPFLCTLLEDLNRWLPPLYGEDCFLWYDEEQIPALEPRRKEKSNRISGSVFMTLNEKRSAMGMEPYKEPAQVGGDSLFVAANQIPVEMAGEVDPNIHPALAEDGTQGPGKPVPKPDPKPAK